jgi:Kef-type K+ transport system membrane component KefB
LDFNPLTKFHSIFHRLDIPVVVGYLIGGKCCEIVEVSRNLMVAKYFFYTLTSMLSLEHEDDTVQI